MPEIVSCQSVLGHIDYVIVMIAASVEAYGKLIADLRIQGGLSSNLSHSPISKAIKTAGEGDLRQIIEHLSAGSRAASRGLDYAGEDSDEDT